MMINARQITTYFKQFRTSTAIRLLIAKVVQRILDPYCAPSYSQTGEDRIIATLLDNKVTGFYVDVGCNRPQLRSNTFELYKHGWRGINIDANPDMIRGQEQVRPRDTSICAAISNGNHNATFTRFQESAVSTLSQKYADEWKTRQSVVDESLVTTQPLTEVLDSLSAPKRFDLLSVDAEDHDYEVISSLDLNRYRPYLVVIEMHKLGMDELTSSKVYEYLTSNNYKMVGYATMNGYFIDSSGDSHLRKSGFGGQEGKVAWTV